jgi:hypothetical protein
VRDICSFTMPAEDFYLNFQHYAPPDQRKRFQDLRAQGKPGCMWVALPTWKQSKKALGLAAVRAWIASMESYAWVKEPQLLSLEGNTVTFKGVVGFCTEQNLPKELLWRKGVPAPPRDRGGGGD